MDFGDKQTPVSPIDTAASLREQGAKALVDLGEHFDDRARKLDPTSLRK